MSMCNYYYLVTISILMRAIVVTMAFHQTIPMTSTSIMMMYTPRSQVNLQRSRSSSLSRSLHNNISTIIQQRSDKESLSLPSLFTTKIIPSTATTLSTTAIECTLPRRNVLLQTTSLIVSSLVASLNPLPAFAATDITPDNPKASKPSPILPLLTTASRLHLIPTYAIVDGNGTPFHTYDKDSASGIGYFFLSYKGAEYVLEDAKKAFEKAKEVASKVKDEERITTMEDANNNNNNNNNDDDENGNVPESWGRAQIVTIPLDYALQLSIKSTKSVALNGRGKTFSTYYQIIPDTSALNTALRIENGTRYRERGRVPLFFVDGMTISSKEQIMVQSGSEGGSDELFHPVYFNLKDLKEEWNKQHPGGEELPPVKVRELNETFRAMIRPGGKDVSVRDMVFVPDSESVDASLVTRNYYKLGEMILTK